MANLNRIERKKIKDRNDIIDISKKILANKEKYVILDTETTGLGKNDVIIQIGMIDLDGNVLIDTLIKPSKRKRMSAEATNIHGITMKMLEDAPTLADLYPKFTGAVDGRSIIIYNAEYDSRLFRQTANQDELHLKPMNALCLMKAYSAFVGEWSEYHQDYKFQKLRGGDHSAVGDCRATLNILHKMATAEKVEPPNRWWEIWK